MDGEVPPTDLCLRLRPLLLASGWLYIAVGFLRVRESPWDFLSYSLIGWVGVRSTWKTLRMNLVFIYLVFSSLNALSDVITVSAVLRDWVSVRSVLKAGGWPAVPLAGTLIAPLAGAFAVFISFWMTKDYSEAVDARAEEERRAFLVSITGGAGGYGTTGFEAFSGRARRLGAVTPPNVEHS